MFINDEVGNSSGLDKRNFLTYFVHRSMLNQLPLEKLYKELEEEFSGLENSLDRLADLFRSIPVSEAQKRQFTEQTLKQKSAWYACLVNQNIDVLLLPEYLESKQSRNILLKKETDQYFKSFDHFDFLGSKTLSDLYACLLHTEPTQQVNSFDLFSSQVVVETAVCPPAIEKMMEQWSGKFSAYGPVSTMVFEFLEWHAINRFSFASQRQIILWLNYQFKKQYGNISYMFNHEHYFFHHWNKESRDMKGSVKELLQYWKKTAETVSEELKQMYKEQIQFDQFNSSQKIISGHLFSSGFKTQYPMPVQMSQYPALKSLLKVGFVKLSDFTGKEDFDKYRELLDQLLAQNFIVPVQEEEILICLNPGYDTQKSRLAAYKNTNTKTEAIDWETFRNQNVVKPIIPVELKIEVPSVPETFVMPELKPVKKKAFFG